jgi:hypothetical protein
MPPVNGFWSLTMYDGDRFFVPNPLDRYTLSQRDELVANADGSVDIFLQAVSPGKDKEANWLPAPKGIQCLVTNPCSNCVRSRPARCWITRSTRRPAASAPTISMRTCRCRRRGNAKLDAYLGF